MMCDIIRIDRFAHAVDANTVALGVTVAAKQSVFLLSFDELSQIGFNLDSRKRDDNIIGNPIK